MPPRRAVRGRPTRRNVEEQWVPNALEVQSQKEVTHAEFCEAIRMLSQVTTYQVGQRDNRQEVTDTSRICKLLRMNPPSFTGSSVTEDPENFIEELKRLFDVMHIADEERANIRKFLTLNPESMSVHEYSLKFTQLSLYAPEMVADMRGRMSLFVVGLSRQSSKEGKTAMLIGDMDLNFRAKLVYSQGSKPPVCSKCGRNHPSTCCKASTGCFKCVQDGHFMRECPKIRQGDGNGGNRA
ncbi:hypothetical protein R3W88_012284 [Solanum pinnatisectum]|uniref:CCHC-type domain-containing protein n=1 Tax=Solanum pinnatisectum TaxID=50273 RepID=A0AAV9L8L3_9SOLN|nr:hypothetical protein R3W88_012284 [Solanum pinnatisectum]